MIERFRPNANISTRVIGNLYICVLPCKPLWTCLPKAGHDKERKLEYVVTRRKKGGRGGPSLWVPFLTALVIFCISCGGGGGSSDSSTSTTATAGTSATAGDSTTGTSATSGMTTTGTTSGIPATVVQPDVTVLKADDPRKVVAMTPTSVTLTGTSSGIAPGAVLVSGQGRGLLRRVSSTTQSGATTVLTTQPASLEDVFETADATFHTAIGGGQVAQFVPAGPGITMEVANPSRQVSGDIVLNLSKYTLSDQQGAKISFSGSLRFSIDCDLHFKIGLAKIKEASCVLTLKSSATATLDCGFSKTFTLSKVHLGTLVGEPIAFLAGEVPVVVVPRLELYSVLDGTAKLGASLSASSGLTAQVGIAYENGAFRSIQSLERTTTLTPQPNFYGSATLSYTPIHAEVGLAIYDVAGPYASFDVPRFELSYVQGLNPAGKQVAASAVFQATAGLRAEIFGHTLADHEFPGALQATFSVYNHFFPDNGSISVGIH